MSSTARAELAVQQVELLRALVENADCPGFDVERLLMVRRALVMKRAFGVAKAWPALAAAMGEQFNEQFEAFAATTPRPASMSALTDGRAFARALARQGKLADVGRIQALAFDLNNIVKGSEVLPRRSVAFAVERLRNPPYLVVGLRLPLIGLRIILIPLGRARIRREMDNDDSVS